MATSCTLDKCFNLSWSWPAALLLARGQVVKAFLSSFLGTGVRLLRSIWERCLYVLLSCKCGNCAVLLLCPLVRPDVRSALNAT